MDYFSVGFLFAVLQIIAIDILLGGDNAVVIALACRRLPEEQRNKGIFWGVAGAIGLRVVLIFFALQLLSLPYLKLVGALLLLWIGIKLLQPEDDNHSNVEGATTLFGAIKTIIIADAVMSLDNVIAVAGAAKGDMGLVVFGILISIPIIVWGSKFVLKLMDRHPIVITLGAALLGWIAGDMLYSDVVIKPYVADFPKHTHYIFAALGALLVVALGTWLAKRGTLPSEAAHKETVAPTEQPASTSTSPLRILVPVDGSQHALEALQHVLNRPPVANSVLHILNVQMKVDSGHVRMFVEDSEIDAYYQTEGEAALASAKALLANSPFQSHYAIKVGHVADTICDYAEQIDAQEIVMGEKGQSALTDAVLGSVASSVKKQAKIPVTLVPKLDNIATR